jgi:copper chaperone CopZ
MGETGITNEYHVTGMVCQHCVSAVTQEIAAIDGVTDVQVDLTTGRVTVTSARPLDEAVIRAAIAEAGYEMSA